MEYGGLVGGRERAGSLLLRRWWCWWWRLGRRAIAALVPHLPGILGAWWAVGSHGHLSVSHISHTLRRRIRARLPVFVRGSVFHGEVGWTL
jgi:hypothetical protein